MLKIRKKFPKNFTKSCKTFLTHLKTRTHSARPKALRGDTLIEVSFAITVFSIVSVLAIGLMNSSMETAQANLEVTMARNEIDAQADALRFIQNSYIADRSLVRDEQAYRNLWLYLTSGGGSINGLSYAPYQVDNYQNLDDSDLRQDVCAKTYYSSGTFKYNKAFIVNTRRMNPESPTDTIQTVAQTTFAPASLYPRVIYRNSDADDPIYESGNLTAMTTVDRVEGLWVFSVRSNNASADQAPEYYDFHIRTCWYSPGRNYPTTIATVIRLYNPDAIEGDYAF